jgi:hypothetical protein
VSLPNILHTARLLIKKRWEPLANFNDTETIDAFWENADLGGKDKDNYDDWKGDEEVQVRRVGPPSASLSLHVFSGADTSKQFQSANLVHH